LASRHTVFAVDDDWNVWRFRLLDVAFCLSHGIVKVETLDTLGFDKEFRHPEQIGTARQDTNAPTAR